MSQHKPANGRKGLTRTEFAARAAAKALKEFKEAERRAREQAREKAEGLRRKAEIAQSQHRHAERAALKQNENKVIRALGEATLECLAHAEPGHQVVAELAAGLPERVRPLLEDVLAWRRATREGPAMPADDVPTWTAGGSASIGEESLDASDPNLVDSAITAPGSPLDVDLDALSGSRDGLMPIFGFGPHNGEVGSPNTDRSAANSQE